MNSDDKESIRKRFLRRVAQIRRDDITNIMYSGGRMALVGNPIVYEVVFLQ